MRTDLLKGPPSIFLRNQGGARGSEGDRPRHWEEEEANARAGKKKKWKGKFRNGNVRDGGHLRDGKEGK